MTTEVSSDEKLMAALSYWGSFVLGFIPALVIFFLKKEESAFIKKQSLQALILNLALFVVCIGFSVVSSIIGAITMGIGSVLMMLIGVVLFLAVAVYFVILGVKVFQGEDVNIPVLTEMIQKNMGL